MRVIVKAYGKINLFLDCLKKRDDGYHEVKMIMQSVRLHDFVGIEAFKENVITSDSAYVPNNKNNLAMRAAMLLQERYDVPPVSIKIKKNIPVSAGMAGGSTDAAAVLVGCNELFKLGLSEGELMTLGAELGSDVPFCVCGGTAIAEGRGELITPLPPLPVMHVVLSRADYGVSTASVYKAILPSDIRPNEALFEQVVAAVQRGDTPFIERHLYNALEVPSFRVDGRTKKRKNLLLKNGAEHILMSGSGPTLFGLYANQLDAWRNFKKIAGSYPNVYLTSTLGCVSIKDRVYYQ